MVISKAQMKAVSKYNKENYDEIKVRVPRGQKEAIKEAAKRQNETLNEFIKKAIEARL